MASAKELVDSAIDANFVAFFSKTYCGFCRRAKNTISELNLGEGRSVQIYECVPVPAPAPSLAPWLPELVRDSWQLT